MIWNVGSISLSDIQLYRFYRSPINFLCVNRMSAKNLITQQLNTLSKHLNNWTDRKSFNVYFSSNFIAWLNWRLFSFIILFSQNIADKVTHLWHFCVFDLMKDAFAMQFSLKLLLVFIVFSGFRSQSRADFMHRSTGFYNDLSHKQSSGLINYFVDILDAKNQPTPGKSIFFHDTSHSPTQIVKLNAR